MAAGVGSGSETSPVACRMGRHWASSRLPSTSGSGKGLLGDCESVRGLGNARQREREEPKHRQGPGQGQGISKGGGQHSPWQCPHTKGGARRAGGRSQTFAAAFAAIVPRTAPPIREFGCGNALSRSVLLHQGTATTEDGGPHAERTAAGDGVPATPAKPSAVSAGHSPAAASPRGSGGTFPVRWKACPGPPGSIPSLTLVPPPPTRGCRNEKKKKLGVSNTPYDGGWWVTDGGWWVTAGGNMQT